MLQCSISSLRQSSTISLLMKTLTFLLLALFLPVGGLTATSAIEEKMIVYVSIIPQKFLVDRIGGDWVSASLLKMYCCRR